MFNTIKLTKVWEDCGGCPQVFAGVTEDGKDFRCSLRWGGMHFSINDEDIVSCSFGDSLLGVCSWEDFKDQAAKEGLFIEDTEVTWMVRNWRTGEVEEY